jgi:hypothetical protein
MVFKKFLQFPVEWRSTSSSSVPKLSPATFSPHHLTLTPKDYYIYQPKPHLISPRIQNIPRNHTISHVLPVTFLSCHNPSNESPTSCLRRPRNKQLQESLKEFKDSCAFTVELRITSAWGHAIDYDFWFCRRRDTRSKFSDEKTSRSLETPYL